MEPSLAKLCLYYDRDLKPWAALISGVNPDKTVTVVVFPDGSPNDGGMHFNVPAYEGEPTAGTWGPLPTVQL